MGEQLVPKVAFAIVLTCVLALTARWLVTSWAGEMSPVPAESGDATAMHVGGLTGPVPGGCRDVGPAEVRATRAARAATGQWELHMGAMNKLVLGAITREQAEEFWVETRQSAARSLAEFDKVRRVIDRMTEQCTRRPGAATHQGPGCAAVVTARRLELDRAETVLDSWRAYLVRTEEVWRGELRLEDATQLWLEGWDERFRQMDSYRHAVSSTQRVSDARPLHGGGTDDSCAG